MLNEEKSSDDALRQQFKEKWTRTPSDKLTDMFRTNLTKYREIINNAIQADRVVREKFETHRQGMEILSRGPGGIESALPSSGGSDNVANTSAVMTLRQLMEEVRRLPINNYRREIYFSRNFRLKLSKLKDKPSNRI